ncbi:MAG: saccharopine dehydrogenase NADP-binding domain-containing protein [Bacteroidia bacterium]
MYRILLLGAGRTAHFFVNDILQSAVKNNWHLRVGDFLQTSLESLPSKSEQFSKLLFDVKNEQQVEKEVREADLVVSLLPAQFHYVVASKCIQFGSHFLSASYVSDEFKAAAEEIKDKGLIFIKEVGLDPGLDHMSAMQMLDEIRDKGGEIMRFLSYTGGLMSPDLKGNPWQYKFTWNPMYVVTAGRDGGIYLRRGKTKRIPYHRLFKEIDELAIPDHGDFDAYYNRDSLKYIKEYKLQKVESVIRYTLRRKGFCEAWAQLVSLGLTDNNFIFNLNEPITNREFLNMFIRRGEGTLEERVEKATGKSQESEVFKKLQWLGLFDNVPIKMLNGTSAQFLEQIIMPKWQMDVNDKDAIYMAHVCYYKLNNKVYKRKSYLAVEGLDTEQTAMAKTVGLPLAAAVKQVALGTFNEPGLHIPTAKNLYDPILKSLRKSGIQFYEVEEEVKDLD